MKRFGNICFAERAGREVGGKICLFEDGINNIAGFTVD